MDLDFISDFFKKNIIVLVVCIFIFSGAFVFVYDEYKENQKNIISLYDLRSDFEKEKQDFEKYKIEINKSIYDERLALSNLKNEFEKEKNKEKLDLIDKRNLVEKREKALDERALDLEIKYNELRKSFDSDSAENALLISEKKKELDRLIAENNEKSKDIESLYKHFSEEALREKAENQIQELIAEFRVLGVDLSRRNECDEEGMKKYRQAQSILDQISAIANSQKVGAGYMQFIRSKSGGMVSVYSFGCN
ncbi:hypothetical protein DFP75_10193 [Marinomonas alcarazii]|uniref:Uncharacterized protein n=1 Tax=Marinomonas alcarazii TaxID=491949 RepID=A0A318V8C1_9GAMM|nr:hypothetical protein [Marinomonas alcarazii]PYF84071.1 hypothetical protein DFP75_10193 [Marinomonas alcarazii]